MPILTTAQVIAAMQAYLNANRPDITTQSGSVVSDVVINAPAQQFGATYQTLSQTQELQSLEFASSMTTAQLDSLGANYGMTRLPGTAATATITFRVQNFNFSSSPIVINSGTIVSTVGTSTNPAVAFTTTSSFTFLPSLAPTYFNPATGFYESVVPIVASVIGTIGNVGAGTIIQLVTSIPGIFAVTNTVAATGGTNVESNISFAQRIIIKLSGNNVGSPNGILSLAEATPGVIQAIVVGPNDVEMLRNQFGGSVDVYIRGQIVTQTTDTPLYTTAGSQQFILVNQPALAVSSVVGVLSSVGGHVFTPGVDYTFVENPNILFAGSVQAGSYIRWLSGGGAQHPDNNTMFTITYTYDSLIASIQATFNNDSNHIVASDILIKEALTALINITVGITIVPGFVGATVVSNVQTALTLYLNGLGLGGSIPLSEVVSVIQGVAGVADVDLNSLIVSSIINAITTTVPPGQILIIPKTAYPVANSLVVTIE